MWCTTRSGRRAANAPRAVAPLQETAGAWCVCVCAMCGVRMQDYDVYRSAEAGLRYFGVISYTAKFLHSLNSHDDSLEATLRHRWRSSCVEKSAASRIRAAARCGDGVARLWRADGGRGRPLAASIDEQLHALAGTRDLEGVRFLQMVDSVRAALDAGRAAARAGAAEAEWEQPPLPTLPRHLPPPAASSGSAGAASRSSTTSARCRSCRCAGGRGGADAAWRPREAHPPPHRPCLLASPSPPAPDPTPVDSAAASPPSPRRPRPRPCPCPLCWALAPRADLRRGGWPVAGATSPSTTSASCRRLSADQLRCRPRPSPERVGGREGGGREREREREGGTLRLSRSLGARRLASLTPRRRRGHSRSRQPPATRTRTLTLTLTPPSPSPSAQVLDLEANSVRWSGCSTSVRADAAGAHAARPVCDGPPSATRRSPCCPSCSCSTTSRPHRARALWRGGARRRRARRRRRLRLAPPRPGPIGRRRRRRERRGRRSADGAARARRLRRRGGGGGGAAGVAEDGAAGGERRAPGLRSRPSPTRPGDERARRGPRPAASRWSGSSSLPSSPNLRAAAAGGSAAAAGGTAAGSSMGSPRRSSSGASPAGGVASPRSGMLPPPPIVVSGRRRREERPPSPHPHHPHPSPSPHPHPHLILTPTLTRTPTPTPTRVGERRGRERSSLAASSTPRSGASTTSRSTGGACSPRRAVVEASRPALDLAPPPRAGWSASASSSAASRRTLPLRAAASGVRTPTISTISSARAMSACSSRPLSALGSSRPLSALSARSLSSAARSQLGSRLGSPAQLGGRA